MNLQLLFPGLLFNASIAFILAFFGFFVSSSFWRELKRTKLNIAFFLFWFLFSFVWFFVGIRHFAAAFGFLRLDQIFFVIGQIFVFLHLLPVGFYIYLKVFKKEKIAFTITGIFAILALLAIIFLFIYGIKLGPVTRFTTEYIPNDYSLIIFKVLFVLSIFLFYLYFLWMIFSWIRKRKVKDLSSFFAVFAVVTYGSLGYFDELGQMSGWFLVLFRLSYLLALFFAYLSLVFQEKE